MLVGYLLGVGVGGCWGARVLIEGRSKRLLSCVLGVPVGGAEMRFGVGIRV